MKKTVNKEQLKVLRIVFPKKDQDGKGRAFRIIVTDQITVKGEIGWRPEVDELIDVTGTLQHNDFDGKDQLNATKCTPYVPDSERGKLIYAGHLTKGMGDKMVELLWNTYGDMWEEKIEVGCVKGFTNKVYLFLMKTLKSLKEKEGQTKVISYLQSKDCTINMAEMAWEQWAKHTIGIVKGNCYELTELSGYGFNDIDRKIRHNFNIADEDPHRIASAVKYAMKDCTSDGSTVAHYKKIYDRAMEVTGGLHSSLIKNEVNKMVKSGSFRYFAESGMLCFGHLHDYEAIILSYVKDITKDIIEAKAKQGIYTGVKDMSEKQLNDYDRMSKILNDMLNEFHIEQFVEIISKEEGSGEGVPTPRADKFRGLLHAARVLTNRFQADTTIVPF